MSVDISRHDEVRQKFIQIDAMSRSELLQAWKSNCKGAVPKNLSRQFLYKALKFEAQCLIFEGQSKGLRRRIKAIAKNSEIGRDPLFVKGKVQRGTDEPRKDGACPVDTGRLPGKRTQPSLTALPPPGTTLVRKWNGRAYQVAITDDGYVLDGQTYGSLSAIAFAITRTKWSGPRFFGLTSRSKPSNDINTNPPIGSNT